MIAELAPMGVLRAAINLGNSTLAKAGPGDGPVGLSVDLATELSRRLAVPLECICFSGAGKVFEAASSRIWDIAFLAVDAKRSQEMEFTSPYVTLSGSFVVRSAGSITQNEQVDQEGIRVVVGKGSAYDLHLSRELKRAEIVRAETSDAVLPTMEKENYEVAAGVRQQLEKQVLDRSCLRLLDGSFMQIDQAMAVRKGCHQGVRLLQAFIEEMKASGFVKQGLILHGIEGVTVANPAQDREKS